ncbi:hypothetical protein PoB_002968500 [Plakobranchus ocellatus]|uniref:Uncharacterized protein n=1 Tax=Plakobranchus ocellatus TaxID=259542 RepID=A0AAV4A8N9_9GAST|nr:hypothetical protein PoB_002968500 [Plakobranchus ocellatus]
MKGMVVFMMNIIFISKQMMIMIDSQTNDDANDESSHDELPENSHTNSDKSGEGSHDTFFYDPQTNGIPNDEEVREGCSFADGQPLLNYDFMSLERLILCLAENENTRVFKELPEGK